MLPWYTSDGDDAHTSNHWDGRTSPEMPELKSSSNKHNQGWILQPQKLCSMPIEYQHSFGIVITNKSEPEAQARTWEEYGYSQASILCLAAIGLVSQTNKYSHSGSLARKFLVCMHRNCLLHVLSRGHVYVRVCM
jgi:hypothetical protein